MHELVTDLAPGSSLRGGITVGDDDSRYYVKFIFTQHWGMITPNYSYVHA